MQPYEDVIAQYKRYLSAAQKKRLRKKAEELSLMNAGERMSLVQKDAERTKKANTLLTDYGLATSLYREPVSGEDALSRRQTSTRQGQGALAAEETAALAKTAKIMKAQTLKKRAAKKKAGSTRENTAGTETGQPGRTVTVRKI